MRLAAKCMILNRLPIVSNRGFVASGLLLKAVDAG